MILKVEFDEQGWQKLIDMLAMAPYRDAAPFIAAIAQQFQSQREAENGKMETQQRPLSERAGNGVGAERG